MHPYNAGREHVGFPPARQTSRKAPARGSASRMKVSCILLRTTREADFRALCVRSCISHHSFESVCFFSPVAFSKDSNGDTTQLPRGCVFIGTLLYVIPPPLREVKVFHSARHQVSSTSSTISVTAKHKSEKEKKTVPWCSSSRSYCRGVFTAPLPTDANPSRGGGAV